MRLNIIFLLEVALNSTIQPGGVSPQEMVCQVPAGPLAPGVIPVGEQPSFDSPREPAQAAGIMFFFFSFDNMPSRMLLACLSHVQTW